jgi:HTH-type transcriptional regulator, competence development regulator
MDLKGFVSLKKEGTSFRQLSERVDDLDHVYLWRLASGHRTAPSEDTVAKMARALELGPRDTELLALLSKTPIDDALFNLINQHPEIPIEDIEPVATMSFRGTRPTTQDAWMKLIELVRSM